MTANKKLAFWLFGCCVMVFMMAVIGAITRLTESGLSITEWNPVTGALPPLSQQAWQHAFDLYRQSPEFRARHYWMNLQDFKHIFFWEWLHRLLARTTVLVYTLPLLWLFIKRRIPAGYGKPLLGIMGLFFLEGGLGWFMVYSGLIHRPSVSHFRLSMHLTTALSIYSALLWTALNLFYSSSPRQIENSKNLAVHGIIALILLATTIIWGAFVAGLHAGLIYNTFPLMDGHLIPLEPFSALAPAIIPGWIQFTHRWLAVTTGITILAYAIRTRAWPLAVMIFVQIGLGISTLLSQVNIELATMHQAGAIILLSLLLLTLNKQNRLN